MNTLLPLFRCAGIVFSLRLSHPGALLSCQSFCLFAPAKLKFAFFFFSFRRGDGGDEGPLRRHDQCGGFDPQPGSASRKGALPSAIVEKGARMRYYPWRPLRRTTAEGGGRRKLRVVDCAWLDLTQLYVVLLWLLMVPHPIPPLLYARRTTSQRSDRKSCRVKQNTPQLPAHLLYMYT